MRKILIADDEERMRRLVGDFLRREGFQILEAADGREALEVFEKEPDICLVILDVMMPVYDGGRCAGNSPEIHGAGYYADRLRRGNR